MFTYTTLFIGSLILAVIGLVVYRVIEGTSRSILSSKGPVSIVSSTTELPTAHAPLAVADAAAWPSARVNAAPLNQVREQPPHQATAAASTKHCSLYDVDPTAPPTSRNDVWPHREEKLESAGKAYKVTRNVPPQASNDEDSDKPWGW